MRTIVITAALSIMAYGVSLNAVSAVEMKPSFYLGTWDLNVAKSKGVSVKSEQLIATAAEQGKVHFTADWVNADGSKGHLEWSTAFDGKANPATGDPEFDSVTDTQLGATSNKTVYKLGAKVIEQELDTLSADKKTLRSVATGKGEDGKPYKNVQVFERE